MQKVICGNLFIAFEKCLTTKMEERLYVTQFAHSFLRPSPRFKFRTLVYILRNTILNLNNHINVIARMVSYKFDRIAGNDRALCRCGIRIPSARNRCPAVDIDKCLEPMFGDVGHARTNAAMFLMMIATTSSHTCTKPIVVCC